MIFSLNMSEFSTHISLFFFFFNYQQVLQHIVVIDWKMKFHILSPYGKVIFIPQNAMCESTHSERI